VSDDGEKLFGMASREVQRDLPATAVAEHECPLVPATAGGSGC